MAIQTQIITGRLSQPNGDPITSGSVRFTLSKFDATDNGVVAASSRIDAPIQTDGSIALELWPNTAGLKGARYSVMLLSEAGSKLEDYGFIRVGNSGPYSLADLLREDLPPATTSYWSKLTQAEFDEKIAQMDARVSTTETARDIAVGARDTTIAARDAAEGYKNAAYANAQDVSSALVYQDLAGIAASKGHWMLAGCIYDTTKDSDGGAWRFRCQGKSWYDEEGAATGRDLGMQPDTYTACTAGGGVVGDYYYHTGMKRYYRIVDDVNYTSEPTDRGSRREFPAVAIIIAEGGQVIIYDGDDPSLPMWMVFRAGETNSIYQYSSGRDIADISMHNARMALGRKTGAAVGGLIVIDFLYDGSVLVNNANHYAFVDGLAGRNDNTGSSSRPANNLGINGTVLGRDVRGVDVLAMEDAPIDPVTGLKLPTVAAATDNGLSFFHGDGTATGRVQQTDSMETVSVKFLNESGDYMYCHGWSTGHDARTVLAPGEQLRSEAVIGYNPDQYQGWETVIYSKKKYLDLEVKYGTQFHFLNSNYHDPNGTTRFITKGASGSGKGLTHIDFVPQDPALSMVAYAAHNYATGWMPRGCVGSYLSSTDASALTENNLVPADAMGGASDFFTEASDAGGSISFSAGDLILTNNTGPARANGNVAFEPGSQYLIKYEALDAAVTTYVSDKMIQTGAIGEFSIHYVAVYQDDDVSFRNFVGGSTAKVRNFSVTKLSRDHSPEGKGLAPYGTLQRTPVAPGAELVAYSGFRETNYLEQPHNPALDFGTGDFCVMGWVKLDNPAGDQAFFEKGVEGGFSSIYLGYSNNANKFHSKVGGVVGYANGAVFNAWVQICLSRKDGMVSIWVNGEALAHYPSVDDLTKPNDISRIGRSVETVKYAGASSLALWRIGGIAPTPEQIAKMYRDEKRLFQPGAACTLYGNTDDVTALAHDDWDGLTRVGTPESLNRFSDLLRVSYEATPITTAIACGAGFEVTQ